MKTNSLAAVIARRFRFLDHRLYVMLVYALHQHRFSTLRNPQTFTDLMAARNLREPSPLVSLTADKYTARRYIAERVGEQHLVPLIQVIEHTEDLDFDTIPVPCVIKATHGYNMNMLIYRGDTIDREKIRNTVDKWLRTNFYHEGWREQPYRDLTPRVVIEEFLGGGEVAPVDYKFYVFHGKARIIQLDLERFTNHTLNLLDMDWHRLDAIGILPEATNLPPPPENLAEMVEIAEKLGAEFDFVRIDLYTVGSEIYVGELTHYPGGGVLRLEPREFDLAIGNLWRTGAPIPDKFIIRD